MAEGLIPVLFYLRRRYLAVLQYPFETWLMKSWTVLNRAILKNVFIINVTQDEEPEDDDLDDEDDKDDIVAEAVAAAERRQE